jgi:hypothetical protein
MALWGYSSKHCEIRPMLMVLPSHCYEMFPLLLPGMAWFDVCAGNIIRILLESRVFEPLERLNFAQKDFLSSLLNRREGKRRVL